jgi:hypothetical protein
MTVSSLHVQWPLTSQLQSFVYNVTFYVSTSVWSIIPGVKHHTQCEISYEISYPVWIIIPVN